MPLLPISEKSGNVVQHVLPATFARLLKMPRSAMPLAIVKSCVCRRVNPLGWLRTQAMSYPFSEQRQLAEGQVEIYPSTPASLRACWVWKYEER